MSGGTEVLAAEASATSSITPPVSLEQPIDPDKYVCGPGDVFELNFWGPQNFRVRMSADLEGRTFISKVGYVAVSGKTLTTVRAEVRKKVRSIYPGLQFDLTLVSPRSFSIHVVENVRQPGLYVVHPVDRVSKAVTQAGGARGSRRRILIKRVTGDQLTADLVRYELTGDTRYNPFLLDGDVISVPAPDVVVQVSGAVRRPGAYELIGSKDLAELFELAGGLTSAAAQSLPVQIVRRNERQQEIVHEHAYANAQAPNAALRDDDRVVVRSADELQRTILLIGAVTGADAIDAATTSKRLPFIEGDTVLSLIERAGGIRAPGDLSRSYITRRTNAGASQYLPVDLEALLVRRDFSADRKLEINDTLVVPPMRYSVLVEGAVGRPGVYNYNPSFGIAEYVAGAGGLTRTAQDLDDARLIDLNGETRAFKRDLRPKPGDAILVPERNFTRAELVQIVIAGAGLILSGVAVTLAATR
jgi:protein involved in polysaccharide export with SLBB domain